MQNIKTYILEKLRVTKSSTIELTFEHLRKVMIDCIERNGGSERFIVSLNSSELEKNPIYTKLDSNKAAIKAILYIDDNYNQQGGWIKLLLDNYTIEISDNQGLHKFLSDESIERLIDYVETYDESVVEKLKVTKSSFSKMTLKEFAEERKSLNSPENNYKLTSDYDDKDIFINWVEKMLVEDGVVDEIPFGGFMKHILRFDGDILFDNIVDDEVDPPVSTELYLTWGEAYMRIVTYYIKNDIFTEPGIIMEKLKVSKNGYEDITYEKFIDEFQNMKNPTIYFENHLDLIGGDYPTFKSYPGMNVAYKKCVGKKFKSMFLVRNIKSQIELHFVFKRTINGTTGIIVSNTDDLYKFLGDDQVLTLYNLIKEIVDAQWI